MKNCKGHIASALASACIVLGSWLTSVAQGAGIAAVGTPPPRLTGGATIELSVPLFQSRVVQLETGANRVSVGNPDIADIVVISPMELYVLGKDLGETNVLLWDSDNKMIGAISVNVVHDLDGLKRKYSEVLPGQAIEVRASQRSIVLSGTVNRPRIHIAKISPSGESSTCCRLVARSRSCSRSKWPRLLAPSSSE
jgi:pilus assembly protein CpaC